MVIYGNHKITVRGILKKGKENMTTYLMRLRNNLKPNNKGMEMVQVAILIAIAVALGLIFKDKITDFVNKVFKDLLSSDF